MLTCFRLAFLRLLALLTFWINHSFLLGGCPVPCHCLAVALVLTPLPVVTIKNVFRQCQVFPREQIHPPSELLLGVWQCTSVSSPEVWGHGLILLLVICISAVPRGMSTPRR